MSLGIVEHTHLWLTFDGGRGCASCEAWESFSRRGDGLIDALPTGLLEQPPKPVEDAVMHEPDLQLDVMNDLLEVSRSDVSWRELEALAERIITRIQP